MNSIADKERAEALEIFDDGACCGNEYFWHDKEEIQKIRKALEPPKDNQDD